MKLSVPAFALPRPRQPRSMGAPAAARLRASTEWVTGITRGRDGVTVVTLEHRGDRPVLRALARQPIGVDAPDEEVAEAIRAALAEAKRQAGRTGRIVASMPARTTIIRQAQFPQLPRNELVAAIQGEARRHIPLDLREAGLDFQVLAEDVHQQQTRVILVAAPRRSLTEQVAILNRAGAEPWIVDAKPLAAINALLRQRPLAPDEALGLLEVSPKGATLTLVTPDGQLLTRGVGLAYADRDPQMSPPPFDPVAEVVDAPVAPRDVVNAPVAPRDVVNAPVAPRDVVNGPVAPRDVVNGPVAPRDVVNGREAFELSPASARIAGVERLAQDMRRSLTFFQQVIGRRATMRLCVVGPAERRDEVAEYLTRVLGLPCITPDPLEGLERAANLNLPGDAVSEQAQDTLAAVGLALRSSQTTGPRAPLFRVNLYMERGRRQQRERRRLLTVMGSSALVMLNVLALAFLLVATHALQGYVKADAAEVQGLKQRTQQLIAASGRGGARRHKLDVARAARPLWSPALAGVVGAQPAGLSLSAVTFAGGLPNVPDDTTAATLTIRGTVDHAGPDPYATVTTYVQALRLAPALHRAFPVVHLSNTWENRDSGALMHYFEIVCAKREAVQ